MKSVARITASVLLLFLTGTLGCDTGTEPVGNGAADEQPEATMVEQEETEPTADAHAIRGTVTAIDRDEPSVTLDHEEIEGFMKAMTMKFQVEGAQLLEGIEEGDQVQGRLVKQDGQFVITEMSEAAE